jgi:sirohydrochlorin cobaltochelatase
VVVLATGLPQDDLGEEAPVFRRDALLLIGHGSERLADAARPLLGHSEVIRETGRFAEVKVGMLFGEPKLSSVVATLTAPLVHVVPMFLNDGYFTRIVIPGLLLPFVSASRVVRFCPPVGSHDGIATLVESRLLRHCETFGTDPKSLSVLLVGHGSAQSPGRARTLLRHAATLEAGGHFGWVRVAYLEEAPLVAEALASSRGRVVAVIACLANEGKHATNDLPCLIAAERDERGTHWPPVHDLGSIGADESMPRLIVDQVRAARSV